LGVVGVNVYLVTEDNVSFCIKAETMSETVDICERSYLDDMKEEKGVDYNLVSEKEFYHEQILQSCSLVGELKN
jgi:hypothetical protein